MTTFFFDTDLNEIMMSYALSELEKGIVRSRVEATFLFKLSDLLQKYRENIIAVFPNQQLSLDGDGLWDTLSYVPELQQELTEYIEQEFVHVVADCIARVRG